MAERHVTYTADTTEVSGGRHARVEPVSYYDRQAGALWEIPDDFHDVFPGDTRRPALFGTSVVASEVQVIPPANEGIGE